MSLVLGATAVVSAEAPPASGPAAKQPTRFAPGVRIDWNARHVEVDAKIVLREGPLELFACSPRTREHEAVVSILARPMHVFQAMGLVGLSPGSPIRYDPDHDRVVPPHGERLQIEVRYDADGRDRTVPIEAWMLDVKRKVPPDRIEWVFAGSRTLADGRFAADSEGTVICVVDFEAALIAPAAVHTADNELLWLTANTDAVPPVDTPCSLIIRSAAGPGVVLELLPADRARIDDGDPQPLAEALDAVTKRGQENARLRLILRLGGDVEDGRLQEVVDRLATLGWDRRAIEIPTRPKSAESKPPGVPDAP